MPNKQTGREISISDDQLDEWFVRKNALEDKIRRLKYPRNQDNDCYRDELLRNEDISYLEKKLEAADELLDFGTARAHYPPLNTYHLSDWFKRIDFSALKFYEPPCIIFCAPHQQEAEVEVWLEKFNRIFSDIDESKIVLPSKGETSLEAPSPHVDPPTSRKLTTQIIPGNFRPGDLEVIVDDVNPAVTVFIGNDKKIELARNDVVGRGTVTWDLLVAFAKNNGLLEGNNSSDVKKVNTPVNRDNLSKKLVGAMSLDGPPIVKGRGGVMRFQSIHLAGGASSPDALDRKTISADDQATELLRRNGDDMPPYD